MAYGKSYRLGRIAKDYGKYGRKLRYWLRFVNRVSRGYGLMSMGRRGLNYGSG
jgi:hypothetical protein